MLSALSVVVNAQADAQWFGILDGVQLSPRRGATRDRKPPMEKSRKAGVQHRPPQNKPTTWDPSANEPTLPYPHIARLSRAFLFSGSGNHHRHAYLLNRPEGLSQLHTE